MNQKLIIGVVILIVILVLGGFYFFNQNISSNQTDLSSTPEDAKNYIGGQTTIIHRDFKAIIKKDWQEFEVPPSTYVYLPPSTAQDDVSAEIISIAVAFLGEEKQYSLEELLEQGIENSKEIMPDFELTENTDGGNALLVGKKIKFTGTS